MKLEKIRDKKYELENKISNLLLEFQTETDLIVDDLELVVYKNISSAYGIDFDINIKTIV